MKPILRVLYQAIKFKVVTDLSSFFRQLSASPSINGLKVILNNVRVHFNKKTASEVRETRHLYNSYEFVRVATLWFYFF